MYKYPEALIDYITQQESEGSEIITTHILDGTMWIITPQGLDKWIVLLTWYDGEESFTLTNISGKALDRVKMVINGDF